jgi:hypothetical protein
LCEVCKLPHIPNAIKHAGLLRGLDSFHLLAASLPGRHHGEVGGWPRDAMRCAAVRMSCRNGGALQPKYGTFWSVCGAMLCYDVMGVCLCAREPESWCGRPIPVFWMR